jgi:rare lipoprotein A
MLPSKQQRLLRRQMRRGWAPATHCNGLDMITSSKSRRLAACLIACCIGTAASAATPHGQGKADARQAAPAKSARSAKTARAGKPALDHSGKARRGKASYYGRKFHGKKMADGTPMNPNASVAASRTLPLGTKAEIVNLESGKKAVVEIRDRGPYVKDRIVDVSPKVADKLDMKEDGVAQVEVKPIEVPQPDGSVKPGAGAPGR